MTDDQLCRVWYIRLTSLVSFPFFQTTRRDHTTDTLMDMMPKKGNDGYLVPVVGVVPLELSDRTEYFRGRPFVNVQQSEVLDLWFKDELPPAQSLRLYDFIQATTAESAQ